MIVTLFTAIAIVISVIIFYNYVLGFNLVIAVQILIPKVVRLSIGSLDISIHTFLIAVLVIAVILKRIYLQDKIIPPKTLWIILLYLGSILILTPFRFAVPVSFQISTQIQFFITEIILGVVAIFSINSIDQLKGILKTIIICTSIACVYGIYTYIISSNPYIELLSLIYDKEDMVLGFSLLEETRGAIQGRIMGTYTHPLAWGQILLLILAFVLIIKEHKTTVQNIMLLLFVVLIIVNIILTGSRASIISLLLLLLFYLFSFNTKKKISLLFLFTIVTLFTIVLMPRSNQTQMLERTAESIIFFWKKNNSAEIGGSSSDMRIEQFKRSFELVERNPFLGLGRGYVNYKQSQNMGDDIMRGYESVIFYKLVEEGILGLIFFFLFYFSLFFFTRKSVKKQNIKYLIYLVNGFYISYLVCIILTGIQTTFFMFILLSILLLKYIYLKQKERCNYLKQYNNEITI